jgi:hypothetical protein
MAAKADPMRVRNADGRKPEVAHFFRDTFVVIWVGDSWVGSYDQAKNNCLRLAAKTSTVRVALGKLNGRIGSWCSDYNPDGRPDKPVRALSASVTDDGLIEVTIVEP